jgi:hypothetical protein
VNPGIWHFAARLRREVTDPDGESRTMARFLIEVPHEPETLACARVVQVFLATGSHFLTHADWGCKDGHHSAWIIVDVDSKSEARGILPPAFRADARITSLNCFTLEEINDIIRYHEGRTPAS